MNNFTFENQGTNTYLVYAVGENESIDSMSLGMLTNNKIPGLAPTIFTHMDASKFFKYNVSAHVSVSQFFSGPVNTKRLLGVFKGIVDAMLAAEDYMIDINTILLDLDYIFADVTTCESVLICLPIEAQEAKNIDLSVFFKNIMFNTQFDQTENCDYVAKIMNYLNSTPVISLSDFKDLLNGIDAESTQAAPQPVVKQPVVQQPVVAEKKSKQQPAKQETAVKVEQPKASQQEVVKPVQTPLVKPVKIEEQKAVPTDNTNSQTTDSGEKMSLFYLLQHYNKENAAIYKAQKDQKKGVPAVGQVPPQKAAPQKVATPPAQPNNFGFAIPGQAAPAVNSTPAPVPTPATPAQPAAKPAAPAQPATPAQQPATPAPAFVPRQVPQGQAANFGETTVLGGGAIGETTVLTASNNPTQTIAPHLIRKKNNEKISLNKPVFRIGKERSYVDYFVGDNTAISRSHANIIIREDSYFVVDTNSTNHTYVNGVMIQSNEEKAIAHGDIVKLANEEFEFRVY